MAILQSGNVTPGHLAAWTTDNVLEDGGTSPAAQKVLATFRGANFNDTGDQPLVLPSTMTALQITGILVTNASISLTTATGGFYPQASKAGTAIVAASQVYSTLTASSVLLSCTLTGSVATTRYSISNLPDWKVYFALTTAQGTAATADIYLLGIDLT